MAKYYAEDNIVLDPIFHVEFDFAIARGCRAMWEAVWMQKGLLFILYGVKEANLEVHFSRKP